MAHLIPTTTFSGILTAMPELKQQDPCVMNGGRESGMGAISPRPCSPDFINDRRTKPAALLSTEKAAKAAGLKGKFQRIKRALFHTKSTAKPRPQSTFRTPQDMAPRPAKPATPSKPTRRTPPPQQKPQRVLSRSGTVMTSRSHGAPIQVHRISFVAPGRNAGLFPGSIERPSVSIMSTSPSGKRMTIHEPDQSTLSPLRLPPKERKTATIRHPVVSAMVPDLPTPATPDINSTSSSNKSFSTLR